MCQPGYVGNFVKLRRDLNRSVMLLEMTDSEREREPPRTRRSRADSVDSMTSTEPASNLAMTEPLNE